MTEPLSNDQIFIRKLTDIVRANLKNENFGVNELARELKMSHYRLGRKLFKAKGEKIGQFIREVRLKKALEILQTEDTTASEVSFIVGFSSPAYFNKCFHEYFGYPPGKVKKVVEANNDLNESNLNRNNITVKKTGRRLFYFSLPVILISVLILGSVTFLLYNKSHKTEPARQAAFS